MARKVPEFSMMRYPYLPPWKHGDPPPDVYLGLKEDQLARVARLQVKYRQQELQIQLDFYKELQKILG